MAKDKIHVQICIDGLDEMLDEIRQLQTYKLGEGNEKTLVGCDDVVNIFRKHLRTKVGTSSDPQWIPVSEGLPEKEGRYWVWAERSFTPDHVDEPNRYQGSTEADFMRGRWYGRDVEEVIAWMPLPKPYTEVPNGNSRKW